MGDRANVAILQRKGEGRPENEAVWLYSHWGGHCIAEQVQAALKKAPDRWTDDSYLARVIFCEMLRGSLDGTTGFGISTSIGDNEYPVLVVDCEGQRVGVAPFNRDKWVTVFPETKWWSFEEYCLMAIGRETTTREMLGDNDQ